MGRAWLAIHLFVLISVGVGAWCRNDPEPAEAPSVPVRAPEPLVASDLPEPAPSPEEFVEPCEPFPDDPPPVQDDLEPEPHMLIPSEKEALLAADIQDVEYRMADVCYQQ